MIQTKQQNYSKVMNMNILSGITLIICINAHASFGQGSTTPEAAVQAALQNHPSIKAAAYAVKGKKYGEKAALNLSNPEINAESPTGEFYAIGVSQSFEFPTVYGKQKRVAKAETALAQAGQRVSESEVRYTARSLYLETQVAEYQAQKWKQRDSLYQQIAGAAIRQFAGGDIDFLQKTMLENEASKVHQERLVAEQTVLILRQQLATYTGLRELGVLLPLQADTMELFKTLLDPTANPSVAYSQQVAQVAETQVELSKSKALPNFSLGYLNQGPRGTPIDYRFRASMGIPIWAGQYRAATNAAKAEAAAAMAQVEAQAQTIALEIQRIQAKSSSVLTKLRYQQNEAMPRSQAIIAAALRMREAGQIDYIMFLRTLEEAFSIQREYAEQVSEFNTAHLQMLYLTGN
jgi:outer membrane protein, heavy metal efflux system